MGHEHQTQGGSNMCFMDFVASLFFLFRILMPWISEQSCLAAAQAEGLTRSRPALPCASPAVRRSECRPSSFTTLCVCSKHGGAQGARVRGSISPCGASSCGSGGSVPTRPEAAPQHRPTTAGQRCSPAHNHRAGRPRLQRQLACGREDDSARPRPGAVGLELFDQRDHKRGGFSCSASGAGAGRRRGREQGRTAGGQRRRERGRRRERMSAGSAGDAATKLKQRAGADGQQVVQHGWLQRGSNCRTHQVACSTSKQHE